MSSKQVLLKTVFIICGACIFQYVLNQTDKSQIDEELNHFKSRLLTNLDISDSYEKIKPDTVSFNRILSDLDTESINTIINVFNELYDFNLKTYDQESPYSILDRAILLRIEKREKFLRTQLSSLSEEKDRLDRYGTILLLSFLALLGIYKLIDLFMKDGTSLEKDENEIIIPPKV